MRSGQSLLYITGILLALQNCSSSVVQATAIWRASGCLTCWSQTTPPPLLQLVLWQVVLVRQKLQQLQQQLLLPRLLQLWLLQLGQPHWQQAHCVLQLRCCQSACWAPPQQHLQHTSKVKSCIVGDCTWNPKGLPFAHLLCGVAAAARC
jgi:hypothetical protein